ncbi:MAG: SprT-like domain-containing protein [Desulfobulbus sp.]
MADSLPVDSRLHAAWLSQLVREYRDICYQYRIDLELPILTISRSRKQLGSWSAGERILSLSHFLISEHPWALTLQVLKHEMAHQICSELDGRDDTGHGPLFRQACVRLGLDAAFHRAGADLREQLPALQPGTAATEPGRQVIEKVRKLLALGESENEHEAALAMQRARELLDRHRLDFAGLAQERQLVHRTINTGSRTLPSHRKVICALLESCFGVRVICASLYEPFDDCTLKTIELLGPEEDVAIAEHCYHFLENRLVVLWAQNRHRFAGGGLRARKSYFLGILAGFRQTLQRAGTVSMPSTEQGPLPSNLPVVQAEERLDAFVAWRFPRLSRRRGRPVTMHGEAYRQAVAAGRELTLHRPVDGEEGATRLLE